MQSELGWSRAAITGGLSVALIFFGLASVPVGHWLDEHGPRLLMTAGSCAAVALVLAWSTVRDLVAFYAIWALIGICMAAVLYGPAFATITVWFRRQRTRALTALTLMAGLASTIFIPLTAWLVEMQGWRAALVTLATILAVVTIVPHALFLRRRPSDLGLEPDGVAAAALETGTPPAHEPSVSLVEALRHPTFRWLVVAFCLQSLGIGVPVHLVPYLMGHGHDIAFAASAAGALGAMSLVGRIFFGPLESRFPSRVVSAGVFVLQPLAIATLLLVPSVMGVIAFVVLFGMSRGAETLLRSTIVSGLYGSRRFASIAGVLTVFITAAQALAPVSLGAAYDLQRSYEPSLWGLAGISIVATAAVYVADRRR